jgi:hypothetical protein
MPPAPPRPPRGAGQHGDDRAVRRDSRRAAWQPAGGLPALRPDSSSGGGLEKLKDAVQRSAAFGRLVGLGALAWLALPLAVGCGYVLFRMHAAPQLAGSLAAVSAIAGLWTGRRMPGASRWVFAAATLAFAAAFAYEALAGLTGQGRFSLLGQITAWAPGAYAWWNHIRERPEPSQEEEPAPAPAPAPRDEAPVDIWVYKWRTEVGCPGGPLPLSQISFGERLEGGGRMYRLQLKPGQAIEDALRSVVAVASALGIGRERIGFDKRGSAPGRADNEAVCSVLILDPASRADIIQNWTGPTFNPETGCYAPGVWPDRVGTCRMYQILRDGPDRYRAVNEIITGIMGAGKSRCIDLGIAERLLSGRFIIWYGDGQKGTSGPDIAKFCNWYATRHDEIVKMLMAAYKVMIRRQRILRKFKWTDDYGNEHAGAGWFPYERAGMKFLQVYLDEAQEPLKDVRVVRIVKELQRLGPKVGIGVTQATQISLVMELGGQSGDASAQLIRAFAKQGNIFAFRATEASTASGLGLTTLGIDPQSIPAEPPGGCFLVDHQARTLMLRHYNPRAEDLFRLLAAANLPELDEASALAAGEDYATRAERIAAAEEAEEADDADLEEDLAMLLGWAPPPGSARRERGGTEPESISQVYDAIVRAGGPVKKDAIGPAITAAGGKDWSESAISKALQRLQRVDRIRSIPDMFGFYEAMPSDDGGDIKDEAGADLAAEPA